MPFQISPGVNFTEKDITTVVPAVPTTEAAIAGTFKWGPCSERVLVDDEDALVARFGKPATNFNIETFFTAANFLAYSNKCYVVRATDATHYNSVSADSANVTMRVLNDTNYENNFSNTVGDANTYHVGRFPGALGNSLKVSVVDSAASFTGTTNTLTISVGSNTATTGNTSTVAVGDIVEVGNSSIGTQQLEIAAIVADTSIQFKTKYTLSTNIVGVNGTRYWKYKNNVSRAPGTTKYVEDRGGVADELHIVIEDEDGAFTGTPGTILRVWEGLSRASDARTESGESNYYKDVINSRDAYIRVSQYVGGASYVNTAVNMVSSSTTAPLYDSLISGADTAAEDAMTLAGLATAYDMFKDPTLVDVSFIMQGKAIAGTNDTGLANYIIDNITTTRRDCVATVSPAKADVVNNPGSERDAILAWRNSLTASSYHVPESGYKYQYDKYNDNYVWVPMNGDIAGIMARTDQTNDPWFSPGGVNRGQLKNVVRLAYNPSKADRDILFSNDINPVITQPGQGTFLNGDKTGLGRPSAFDAIGVRRLFIVLEKAISRASRFALFEFNDEFTQAQFRNLVEPFLRDVQGRRGITDFRVVCDGTNNTPEVVDRNEFIGDIYIKPARSIRYVQLNFVAVRTGVEFSEIVGQV